MSSAEKPVQVCMFSYYFPPHFSGAGLYAVSLAKELRARDVPVFFVTVDNSGLPRQDTYAGFDVYRIADGPRRHGELILWANLYRLLRPLRRRFSILHATGSTYRNSGVGPVARLLGKRSLTVVSMAHNDLYPVGRTMVGHVQRLLLRCVDRYVSLSHQITEEIRTLPLDATRAVEIPQGVDIRRFAPATEDQRRALRQEHELPDRPLALYVGVVDRRKNVEWLVHTWARHRSLFADWTLLILGPKSRDARDGHLRDALRSFVGAEGLDGRILFRDFTPSTEEYYRAADLFLLPSENEGMPNVLLEAMACGLPAIVTLISGATDLITPGETGALFPLRDEARFVEEIRPFLGDRARRAAVGARARARVAEGFSTSIAAARYLDLYHDMLRAG